MTDPTTDIEVGIDPNGEAPRKEPAIEVKGVAKYLMYSSLLILVIGLIRVFTANTWTVVYIGLADFTLSIIAMLVIAEIERRRK